tara:strand:- start:45 stop:170 length:126 start_codon:yes stop_codon:yes gene_type:complete
MATAGMLTQNIPSYFQNANDALFLISNSIKLKITKNDKITF